MPFDKLKKCIYVLILLQFQVLGIHAQLLHSKHKLHKLTKKFSQHELLKHASISFQLYDLKHKKVLASIDDQRSLVPASIQKIISCASILNSLGPKFKYETQVYLLGKKLSENSFSGDLVIKGSGDPSLGSISMPEVRSLESIVDSIYTQLHALGISVFQGDLKIDDSFIQDIPENPEWLYYDLGNYYGAGCFGLNYLENRVKVVLNPAPVDGGICPVQSVSPDLLKTYYSSKVVGSKDETLKEAFVLGTSNSTQQEVYGNWTCCKQDSFILYAAMSNPAFVFKKLLRQALENKGILFEANHSNFNGDTIYLNSIYSPDLEKLCSRALAKSVNLYCESFLHQFAYFVNQTTIRKEAISLLENYVSKLFGENDQGFVLEDGSGLSPKNMLSAWQMNQFLIWLDFNSSIQTSFWKLLPDAMQSGKLKPFLKPNKKNQFGLRLKSGSMERIQSYSGYITQSEKPRYCLTLMINHYSCANEEINELLGNFINQLLN